MKFILLLLLFSSYTLARWAKKSEEAYILTKSDINIQVKKDGTFTTETYKEFDVVNEIGVKSLSFIKVSYTPASEKFKLLSAQILDGETFTDVAKDVVEEKGVSKVFDPETQVKINFKKIKAGSRIILKYQISTFKPVIPNQFSYSFLPMFTRDFVESGKVKIYSEIPLKIDVLDPQKLLKIEDDNKKPQTILVTQLRPLHFKLIEEEGLLNQANALQVNFSSFKFWEEIGRYFEARFNLALNSTAHAELTSLITEAKKMISFHDKIYFIESYLAKNFTYIGDFKSINGAQTPRMISEIYSRKEVDDKEMAVLLTYILRKLDLKADVALVYRRYVGEVRLTKFNIPQFYFNHAIVRLLHNGETYWIDPTYAIPVGLNHFEDLALRDGFVLANPYDREKIPLSGPQMKALEFNSRIKSSGKDNLFVISSVTAKGSNASSILNSFATKSKGDFEKEMIYLVTQGNKFADYEFRPITSLDKEFPTFEVGYKYQDALQLKDNNKIISVPYPKSQFWNLLVNTSDWEGDFFLDGPQILKQIITFEKLKPERSNMPKSCVVNSPWLKIKRSVTYFNEVVTFNDEIQLPVRFVSNKDIKTEEFLGLKNQLSSCLDVKMTFVK